MGDKNRNGVMDKEEMKAFKQCLGIDFDGDGKVSPKERACAKIVDKDENFKIDENERKAMIACLKESAKAKHKPPSKKEIKCKKEADLDKNGKIEAEEIEAFEKCMAMKPGKKGKKKVSKKKATKA